MADFGGNPTAQPPRPDPTRYTNKQLFLILNGICRFHTLVVAIFVTAIGFRGIHSSRLKDTFEWAQRNCNSFNGCPTAYYDFAAFQVLAPLTLVLVFFATLIAGGLHWAKLCGCAWILDAIVQAGLALLSLTTGSILIHGANGFKALLTTVVLGPTSQYFGYGYGQVQEVQAPTSDQVEQIQQTFNYDHLVFAGSLAIINTFIFALLIVLIVLSKPDKPMVQQQPMTQQQPMPAAPTLPSSARPYNVTGQYAAASQEAQADSPA